MTENYNGPRTVLEVEDFHKRRKKLADVQGGLMEAVEAVNAGIVEIMEYHDDQKYVRHLEQWVQKLQTRLDLAAGIIELADHRASAVDGPVGHCRDEMSDDEWRQLYVAVKGED